jgi:nucleoside-diphosphate-sugar epimerase
LRHLVTGCAGFIGSSLVRALLDRGDEVVGVDNFSTGKRANIAGLSSFTCIEGDLMDVKVAEEACSGVDIIYHHAAVPFGPQSHITPNNDANVTATLNILLAAQKAKVRRIVYAGSYSAYGESRALPNREDMAPDPVSPYAVSKLVGEYYMKSFHRVYGMETVVLRYFNVFGPRQDEHSPYSGALARVIVRMLAHEHPVIDGDGSQTREFTYVDDVVQANLLAGTAKASYVAGQVLNVATGSPVTFNEVLDVLNGLIRYRGSVPEFRCLADAQVRESLADISKARRLLNYRPEVDLREGLRRTVNWYEGSRPASLGMAEARAFA